MTYQINIIHPKAAVLLQNLAEIGLITIGEDKEVALEESIEEAQLDIYDHKEIPPIVKSMLDAFEATSDFDYKEELTGALAKKYL